MLITHEPRLSPPSGIVAIMDDLVRAMDAAASPENARALARYFKVAPGSYGEGDIFLGLKLGELRRLAKPYLDSAFEPDQWLQMLRSPIHEHRLITLVVMSERAKKLVKRGDDDELRLIYDTYLGNTSHVNNWDQVDISCGPIVGGYLLDRDRSPLYQLVRSGLLWDRRIAMVGSQRFLRRGETTDLYRLAEILLPDRHDLIHKAVGWSLREGVRKSTLMNCVAFLISTRQQCPVRRCVIRSNISIRLSASITSRYREHGRQALCAKAKVSLLAAPPGTW
jgi:3-methyladenine DNA glycosylase AlkD